MNAHNEFKDIFNVAVSSEVQENTQQLPKNKKEQLVMYWKSIAILAAEGILNNTKIKEIVMKYSLTDPTAMEVLAKVMLAQCTMMKPTTTHRVDNIQTPRVQTITHKVIPTTTDLRRMFSSQEDILSKMYRERY